MDHKKVLTLQLLKVRLYAYAFYESPPWVINRYKTRMDYSKCKVQYNYDKVGYLLVEWDTSYCVKYSIDDPVCFYKLTTLHLVEFFSPGIGKFVRYKFS